MIPSDQTMMRRWPLCEIRMGDEGKLLRRDEARVQSADGQRSSGLLFESDLRRNLYHPRNVPYVTVPKLWVNPCAA